MINNFERSAGISTTEPYAYDDIAYCFRSMEGHTPFFNIYLMFDIEVWICQVGIVFTSIFVWYVFLRFDRVFWQIHNYFHIAFYIFAGGAVRYKPKHTLVRIVFGIHMIGSVLFVIVFNSLWINSFTKSHIEQIDTVEQALAQDFKFAGEGDFLHKFNDHGLFETVTDKYRSCNNIDNCLIKLKTNKKLAVLVSRAHARNNPYVNESDLYCFSPSQHVYSYSIVMLTREKHFCLLPKINHLLQKFAENGLLKKWINENEIKRKSHKNLDDRSVDNSRKRSDGIVTLNYMQSTIFNFFALQVGAVTCLITEIITAYVAKLCKKRGITLPFIFHLSDWLLNNKRYFFKEEPALF